METQEKINVLEKELHKIKGTEDMYITGSGDYFYIHKKDVEFNLGSGNYNSLLNYLKGIKKTRYTGKNIEKCISVCRMISSILAYHSHTVQAVMNNKYLRGELYNISDRAKATLAEYLISRIKENGYAGDDGEGCSYNYLTYSEE